MADKETLLEKAKRRFKLAVEAERSQRERERDDLRFQVAEYQWDEQVKKERQGRPLLSVSLLHQPMQLVQNQAAAAKLGVSVHPVTESAGSDCAEIKQGLYRRIERDSNADQARLWALDRAKQCGKGWYRVNTQWDEDGDDPFDQEIVIERILHQESVYMDPAAQKADYSDAEFGFVVAWMAMDTFKDLFPSAKTGQMNTLDFEQFVKDEPDWVKLDGREEAVLVAEYFYKVHEREEIEGPDGRTRKRDKVSVKWCKLTGAEVLEEEDWNGSLIPLIVVPGRELQPIDGERRWEGMIRPARDGQRFFNYAVSTAVEKMALEPKAPFIMAEGQDEGHEEQWKQANIRNFPYLVYKPTALGDKLVGPPQRAQIDQTGTSLAFMAMEQARNLVQSATAVYDASLGESNPRKESGRAILALQQQADAGTSNYLQNLATVSMPYEARVVLDLMPAIYDRPGRITRVLGQEDDEKIVMLGKPFVMDPRTGLPTEAEGPNAKYYDLTKGKYSTSVSIGKSYQTRLQQGQEELGELLPNLPPEAQVMLLPTYLKFRDTPGAKEAAELMKKFRDARFPEARDDEGGAQTLEQAQAQIQAMKQEMQMAQMQLQMAIQQIQTDQAKQQAMLQKADMDNQTKLAMAQMQAQQQAQQDALKLTIEKMQIAFETWQTKFEAAHDVAMGAAGGRTMSMERGQEAGEEREDEQENSSGASESASSSSESGMDSGAEA